MLYALKLIKSEIDRLSEVVEYGKEIKMTTTHPEKLVQELKQAYDFIYNELNDEE